MFERDEAIQRKIDEVYQLTVNLDRGDVLTHTAISEVLGLQPHEGSWGHIVNRVRRRLRDLREIECWPDETVGYRLLTISEQLRDLPIWRARKMQRQNRMRLRAVEAISDSNLSFHERKAKVSQVTIIRESARAMRREAKEQQALLSLRPMTPRRPMLEGFDQ